MKKIISIIILSVMLSVSVFGCSQSGTEIKENTENSIVIWANLNTNEIEELQKIADTWEKKNGKEVIIYSTAATGADFIETAKSSKPDMFFGVSAEDAGRLSKAGACEEIPEDFISQDEYVSDDLIKATSMEGKQIGVPVTQETVVLYYNKDLVDEVPETMEEVVDVGKEKGLAFEVTNYYFSYGFVLSQGGYTYKENEDGSYDINNLGVNNEGAIKGYKFIQDLTNSKDGILGGITDYLASTKFSEGNTAFYIGESGRIRTFDNAKVNYGISKIPSLNGKEVTPYKYVRMAVVSKDSSKKEETFSLLKEFIQKSDEIFMKTGPYAPVYAKSLDSNTYNNNEKLQVLLDECNSGVLLPNNLENEAINMVMSGELTKLVQGEVTPEECGKELEEEIPDTIDKVLTYDD